MASRFRRARLITSLTLAPAAAIAACGPEAADPTSSSVALVLVTGADHGGRPLTTVMTQEVTAIPIWQGDPDGSGTALLTLNQGLGEVCWELAASDITLPATAAHIHQAAPSVRGPIVLGLSAPDATGVAHGCASGIDRELIGNLLLTPEAYYVNVHTTDYPPGAIRGQLPR